MVYYQSKKITLGKFMRTLCRMENVGIFMVIWNILRSFSIFLATWSSRVVVIFYIFPVLVYYVKKIWQPCLDGGRLSKVKMDALT
jgi:hypothetical protein